MAKMAADPETQRWWKITDPMQEPFATRKETGAKAVVPGLFGEQGGWLSASGRKFRPITLLVGTGSIDAVTSIPFSR
jgi:hypothetical protein